MAHQYSDDKINQRQHVFPIERIDDLFNEGAIHDRAIVAACHTLFFSTHSDFSLFLCLTASIEKRDRKYAFFKNKSPCGLMTPWAANIHTCKKHVQNAKTPRSITDRGVVSAIPG